ncbi:MAG TPA: metallophosphoesterase, partial [Ohtaekwangia sp.]|nr:metallophosphoesterase [Ohtaekwangia sp.]
MNSRRTFLKNAAAAGAIGALMPSTFLTARELNARPSATRERALRIAHITDVHILDKPHAENYFSQVMQEINALADKPDMIINTGDTVMDENKQTLQTVEARWAAWNRVVKTHNKLPLYSALGNHDVWYGPDERSDAEYKKDSRYGKQWAMQELGMPSRYYSFEKNGWYFIALDSINGTKGYQLDDAQFEWLGRELGKAGVNTPVCIFNHVPILSMGALLYYTKRKPIDEVKFPAGDMHNDHQR